jgi:hypothetical protein
MARQYGDKAAQSAALAIIVPLTGIACRRLSSAPYQSRGHVADDAGSVQHFASGG